MTLHKLLAAAACAVLLTACDYDPNDERIETYKKCQAAGMDTVEGVNGMGSSVLFCEVPRAKP